MRLAWGCGSMCPPGWVGSDRSAYGQEHVGNLLDGLPWPDGHFEAILANHSLQQLGYHDLVPGLSELRRVLAGDGVLRVLVPDIVAAFDAWQRHDRKWFPVSEDEEPTVDGALSAYLTWFGTNLTGFTAGFLKDVLHRAGFGTVAPCRAGESRLGHHEGVAELDDRRGESLVYEAMP